MSAEVVARRRPGVRPWPPCPTYPVLVDVRCVGLAPRPAQPRQHADCRRRRRPASGVDRRGHPQRIRGRGRSSRSRIGCPPSLRFAVQNLDRLNDAGREESDGIYTLAIVENLVEFRPEVCKEALMGLLGWLVKKLKVKVAFDANKLYASEIQSILLQTSQTTASSFGEMSGSSRFAAPATGLLQKAQPLPMRRNRR